MSKLFVCLFLLYSLRFSGCDGLPPLLTSKVSPLTNNETLLPVLMSKMSPTNSSNETYEPFFFTETICVEANIACNTNLTNVLNTGGEKMKYDRPCKPKGCTHYDINAFFLKGHLIAGSVFDMPNLSNGFPNNSFLPPAIASVIPIDEKVLKQLFPCAFTSAATKKAIESTIVRCNSPPLEGEKMICAKYLEEILYFAESSIGTKSVTSLVSINAGHATGKKWTVNNIKQVYAKNGVVSCHQVFLPFAAFYCHLIPKTSVYEVSFIDNETGALVKNTRLVVICHLDTSAWSPDLMLMSILKTFPGKSAICHFLTETDIIFL